MKNISEHSDRIKTAVVILLAVGAVGLANNGFLTWLFLGTIYMVGFKEALKLVSIDDNRLYIFPVSIWILTPFYPHPSDLLIASIAIMGAVIAYKHLFEAKSIIPILYPGIGIVYAWMLFREYNMLSLLWLVVVVALTDTGAYYTGKKFGKTPFSPTSPKKTKEGVIGGIIIGSLGGTLVMIGDSNIFINAIFIALFTSIASIFGDLFESWLKREAGVKDSGDILPGHGGILDRIDGYIFASVTLYIMLKITGS